MPVLAIVGIAIAAAIALLVIVILCRPSAFRVARSLRIAAAPAAVHARIADVREWHRWNPWSEVDPTATITYSQNPVGVGASYHWNGNKNVGEGRMTITDVKPGEHVGFDIEFMRPFKAKNRVTFDLVGGPDGTTVTWAMSGKNGFMGKAMGLVFDCDKMVGPQYEKGLATLKKLSESGAPVAAG